MHTLHATKTKNSEVSKTVIFPVSKVNTEIHIQEEGQTQVPCSNPPPITSVHTHNKRAHPVNIVTGSGYTHKHCVLYSLPWNTGGAIQRSSRNCQQCIIQSELHDSTMLRNGFGSMHTALRQWRTQWTCRENFEAFLCIVTIPTYTAT